MEEISLQKLDEQLASLQSLQQDFQLAVSRLEAAQLADGIPSKGIALQTTASGADGETMQAPDISQPEMHAATCCNDEQHLALARQVAALQEKFSHVMYLQEQQREGGRRQTPKLPLQSYCCPSQTPWGLTTAELSDVPNQAECVGTEHSVIAVDLNGTMNEHWTVPSKSGNVLRGMYTPKEATSKSRRDVQVSSEDHDANSASIVVACASVTNVKAASQAPSSAGQVEPCDDSNRDERSRNTETADESCRRDAQELPSDDETMQSSVSSRREMHEFAAMQQQLESRTRELLRMQSLVRKLETKLTKASFPKTVLAQAAELQRRNAELEEQLRHVSSSSSNQMGGESLTSATDVGRQNQRDVLVRQPVGFLAPVLGQPQPCTVVDATSGAKNADSQTAVAKWSADKRLQRRIVALQKKLIEREDAYMAAKASSLRLQENMDRLKADLEHRESTCRELKKRLERAEAKLTPGGMVPARALQSLLSELHGLQQRHDELERRLLISYKSGAQLGSPGMHACNESIHLSRSLPDAADNIASNLTAPQRGEVRKLLSDVFDKTQPGRTDSKAIESCEQPVTNVQMELKILDLELARDQATAHAHRLQERLEVLAAELGKEEAGLRDGDRRQGRSMASSRETQLLDTISLLKDALEKTRNGLQSGVSNSKYMQALDKARAATARVKDLEAKLKEADEMSVQLQAARRENSNAQTVIASLRGQLRTLQKKRREAISRREQIMNAQVMELERALVERDAQLAAVKTPAYEDARALVAEGLSPRMLVAQLLATRSELQAANEREEALRKQLDLFKTGVESAAWKTGIS